MLIDENKFIVFTNRSREQRLAVLEFVKTDNISV